MAGETRPPSGGRRRPPTVINLEATEVANGPTADETRPDSEAAAASAQESPAWSPDAPPPPESALPPSDPPAGSPDGAADEQQRVESPPPRRGWAAMLPVNAVVAGALSGLVVFLALWLAGAFAGGRDADLSPRLAAIEKQL